MNSALGSKLSSGKSSSAKKIQPKSLRFSVDLNLGSKNSYTHFSLKKLILDQKQSSKQKDNSKLPSSNPFGDEDSDEEVKRLAAKFEKKYGSSYDADADGYIDRGGGYDASDPFVDNSEAYDELIPHELTTEFGGFYINSGELNFKIVDGDENEDVFQKANLLQKLKRKRNKNDEEEIEPENIKRKQSKPPKSLKLKPCKELAFKKVNPSDSDNIEVESKPKKVSQEPKIKDSAKTSHKKVTESNQQQQSSEHGKSRKSKSSLSQDNSSSMLKSQKPSIQETKVSLQSTVNAASLAQNLYSTKIQQMITDSLLGNLNPSSTTQSSNSSIKQQPTSAATSSTIPNQSQNLITLKTNLLNMKVPYDIVSSVPITKPTTSDRTVSPEWNRYLIDIYKKTSTINKSNRAKIYESLAKYIGDGYISGDDLILYSQQLLNETTFNPNPSSSSNLNNSVLYRSVSPNQNSYKQMTSKKVSNNRQPGSPVQAINLSTTTPSASGQSSTFNEGLAGKLMVKNHQNENSSNSNTQSITSRVSPVAANSKAKASNLPTGKTKNTDAYGILNHHGMAMLQTLANRASSSTAVTSSLPSHSPSVVPSKSSSMVTSSVGSMPPPLAPSPSSSLISTSNPRSTTPPTLPRSTTVPNPNSLLAAFALPATTSASKQMSNTLSKSSSSPSSNQNPQRTPSPSTVSNPSVTASRADILSSFFQLPNMFTNANLISHFLNNSPNSPSSTGISSRQTSTSKIPSPTSSTPPTKNSLLLNNSANSTSNATSTKGQSFNTSSLIISSPQPPATLSSNSSPTVMQAFNQSPNTSINSTNSNRLTSSPTSQAMKNVYSYIQKQQSNSNPPNTSGLQPSIVLPNQHVHR